MQVKPTLDTNAAAKYLDVAPITLKCYRHKNKGPAYHKIGNRVKYEIPDLEAYKRAHRVEPEGAQ